MESGTFVGTTMESIRLNGRRFNRGETDQIEPKDFPGLSAGSVIAISEFLNEWWNNQPFIEVQTSGSTGTPKTIRLPKKSVEASADKTIAFFGLKPNTNILLCLPVRYIAGKLMLVRAIRGELNVVLAEPDLNPLENLNAPVDFAAMIPAQAIAALNDPENKQKLLGIHQILLGGAPLEPIVEEELAKLPNRFFHSYGMTETATHVALREIGKSSYYRALEGVRFEADQRGCLVIHAGHLPEKIITNDLVELHDENSFTWLGRFDNVIISGGIKHIPERLEAKLAPLINGAFYVTSAAEPVLGQKLVLVIEGMPWDEDQLYGFHQRASEVLTRHEIPKEIRFQQNLTRTETGKVKRNQGRIT